MVSVIVPAYNVERYIAACIDSVLAQTRADWELILVDDGSTDGTGAICDRYAAADARIRCAHRKNAGAGPSRNCGMELAEGEWLMFLDGDDQLEPTVVEELLSAAGDGADIACCGFVAFNEESGLRVPRGFFPGNSAFETPEQKIPLYLQLMDGRLCQPPGKKFTAIGVPWGKLYRAQMLRDAGLSFPALRRMQDNLFNMHAFAHARRIVYLDRPLYRYRLDHIQGNFPPPEIRYAVLEAREEFFAVHPELALPRIRSEFYWEKIRCLGAALKARCSNCKWPEAQRRAHEVCMQPIYARALCEEMLQPLPARYRILCALARRGLYGPLALLARSAERKEENG